MIVYKSEIDAGIGQLVEQSTSIAYHCPIVKVEKFDVDWNKISANIKHDVDNQLFYFESILVSTGWNLNDDIFLPTELWAAKASPINKPVNFMHNEQDIIGHMISAQAVDFDGKPISDVI